MLTNKSRDILAAPSWYMTVVPELRAFTDSLDTETSAIRDKCKKALYDFFEQHLASNEIALGYNVGGFDSERKAIDTVVIHHTSNPPGLTPSRLSAIELIRLYAPYFAYPSETESYLKGQTVFSGHVRDGNQVFWPYHWLVRNNGSAERLLMDSEIG